MTRVNEPETDRPTAMLRDLEVEATLVDAVTLNDQALDEEFVRIAADVAYWNARYADALDAHLRAEHECKVVRDRATIETRAELREKAKGKTGKGKEVTETEVKSQVGILEEVLAAELWVIETQVTKERMRRYADAVAVKKDALQSLGARLRIEMERDASVRRRYGDGRAAARDRAGVSDDL